MEPEFSTELQSQAYEVLSSNDNDAMETLFSHFHSPHQPHQSQAHTFFQCCKKHHPDLLFIKLFFLLRFSPHVHTRSNAALLLRFLKTRELWPNLRPVAQASIQSHFLHYLKEEDSMPVLRLVSVVVADTVSVIYNAGQRWPELLEFLLWCLGPNDDDKFREIALLVFGSLPKDCRCLVCEALSLSGAVLSLHSSFLSALASSNPDVQVASFGAVVSLVRLFSDHSNRSLFHELLRAMMVGVFTLLNGFQDSYFRSAFVELITLVSQEPQLLKPYLSDMVLDMLQIAESPTLNKETHCLAIRLVITMTELKDCKPILLNLPYQIMVRLFLIPMKMLLCVEEEDNVGNELEGDQVDEFTGKMNVYKFGIKFLNQLSITLGGSKVVPIASELLPLYLDAPDWKKRHAGITMLSVIAKEFSDEMVI